MSVPETPASDAAAGGDVRELRLAVVLYGGASLAIYMHGTTKELQRLVKASALADRGAAATTASERVYGELLAALAGRDPAAVRTRVVIDVVAGTSAGGINGVFLSKALAHNRSQDSLRDLWFDRGDIKVLLRGPGWLPPLLKVPLLLAGALKKPVLKGDAIARWMYGALRDMDAGGSQPAEVETLMPESHPLELFVTVTDFHGYRRDVVISDPKLIGERAHRHVLSFRLGDGVDQFDEAHNGVLAFSARTTMSFPGAFPPISLASFQAAVAKEAGDVSAMLPELFRIYALSHADPRATFFIDGGVLDNKPFGHAIDAIKRRAAESEVDRRLLYLEPDPGDGGGGPAPGGGSPSPIATVLAAISGLPRQEPVLDDILEVVRHNERVRRIRDIIETSFDPIGARIVEIVGADLGSLTQNESAAEIAQWRTRINEDAKAAAGFAYATYIRTKVSGVLDSFAQTICRLSDFPDDSNQASFVRGVVRSWGETRLYRDEHGRQVPADDLVPFLRTFDLPYSARRLRFVTDGLSWWYADAGKPGYPTRAQLDEGKRALYEARETLLDAMNGRKLLTNITADVLAIFAQAPIDMSIERGLGPDEYAAAHADELARLEEAFGKALDAKLAGAGEALYRRLFGITGGWAPERRADLLVRYLGFPYWDVLLYPIQAVADAGERDAIEVVRMSPKDTKLLPPLDPHKPKLAGFGTMHFGAFFDRAGRENDYLWGRLDGAERLIGLVLGDGFTDDERTAWCRKAFAAIVEEEDGALAKAKPLLDHARTFAGS